MFGFLSRYAYLSPDGAWLLVAFALASWFPDCVPVAPVLHLLGPDNEARLVLRLLACISRRPVLLSDIDVPALATLPGQLDPTLLIGQRNLPRSVMRVWWHPMFATFLSRMEMVSFTPMARRLFLPTPNPCPRRACGSAFCQRWIRYRH